MSLPGDSPFSIAALVLGALGAIIFLWGFGSLFRFKLLGFTLKALAGALLMAIGALAASVAIGMQGYRALTRETVAARLSVKPTAMQRFTAVLRYPDGRQSTYAIAGDEIYVDARVLKWKPVVNVLGLHTVYELDRISGRYRDVAEEKTSPRTVYALGEERPVNLFDLRRRYTLLEPLLDAEYGSGTFVPVIQDMELEVLVSTSGLLIREVKKP